MKQRKLSYKFIKEFQKDYRSFISKLISEHGDEFVLKGSFANLHIIANPKYIEHLLVNNASNYIRPHNDVVDILLLDKNVSLKEGNLEWEIERIKIFNPSLAENVVKKYTDAIVESTAQHLDLWEKAYYKTQKPISINLALPLITLAILSKALLGDAQFNFEYVFQLIREAHFLLMDYEKSITKIDWKLPFYKHRRAQLLKEALYKVSSTIVEHCLSNQAKDNLIRDIAKFYRNGKENLKLMLVKRVVALLLGGFDSVGVNLTSLFITLSYYPLIMNRISEEVKNIMGDRQLVSDDIHHLPYTRAVVQESLRLSALPFLPRLALNNDRIGDYVINKNDRILIPTFYLHRSAQYWKNPEGFDPNRFLKPLDISYNCIYLPFSIGSRGCVGKHLALQEMTIILAMIIQRYKLCLVPNQNINQDFHFLDPALHFEVAMTLNKV